MLLRAGGLGLSDGRLVALEIGIGACVAGISPSDRGIDLGALGFTCTGFAAGAFAVNFRELDLVFGRLGIACRNGGACALRGDIGVVIDVDLFTFDLRLFRAGESVIGALQFLRRIGQHVGIRRGGTHIRTRFHQ